MAKNNVYRFYSLDANLCPDEVTGWKYLPEAEKTTKFQEISANNFSIQKHIKFRSENKFRRSPSKNINNCEVNHFEHISNMIPMHPIYACKHNLFVKR